MTHLLYMEPMNNIHTHVHLEERMNPLSGSYQVVLIMINLLLGIIIVPSHFVPTFYIT